MAENEKSSSIAIRQKIPFDLPLSLAAAASFLPSAGPPPKLLWQAVRVEETATVTNPTALPNVLASPRPGKRRQSSGTRGGELAEWITAADLDLLPFYRLAADRPIMRPITESLDGLKPLRPASLFEMLVIAITEQQLSLAAAFRIRSRLVIRFGTSVGDLWLFPGSETLAGARVSDLRACGLSERKAGYIRDLARHAAEGQLCFESVKRRSDAEVRELLSRHR